MGERFYLAQQQSIGTCPGINPNKKRKRKMAWDDESKARAVALYEAGNPTPANSMEVVANVAEEMEETVNGVRMILTKAGVYIKKEAAAGKSGASKTAGAPRVSKEDAHKDLTAAITDAGQEADEEIITKMTGKAAVYFAKTIRGLAG